MDLSSLPPPPHCVVLKGGKPYWALNLAEAYAFWDDETPREDQHANIAVSRIVGIVVSTVLLPVALGSCFGRTEVILGEEATCGQAFETMVSLDAADATHAQMTKAEQFFRHDTLEEAVLFHLGLRQHYSEEYGAPAQWLAKPFRFENHGAPSNELRALIGA